MRVLFWQWHSFMGRGVEKAFQKLNVVYDTFFYQLTDWEKDQKFQELLSRKLNEKKYDLVFSINYTPLITEVCENRHIAYISWIYDSPIHIRDEEKMFKKCNQMYCFDRGQAQAYQKRGIQACHLPLAADTEIFRPALMSPSIPDYNAEVSLVGKLYETEYLHYKAPLSEYLQGYLEGIINAQMEIYGGYIIPAMVTDQLLDELNGIYAKASKGKVTVERREAEFLLASEVTRRERYLILSLLAKHAQVKLYSSQTDENLKNICAMGYVDYYTQMPKVFAQSKINLNISLKTIHTGIPLRVLDVLACGGFLISNYQEELEEYFRVGEELVIYQDIEELVWLTEYYLTHDTERREIAERGQQRIKKDFRFEDKVQIMLGKI